MIKKMIVMLMVVGLTVSAMAAFVPPTRQQINQVAGNPASISALLFGANPEQAANVIKAVMVSILSGGQAPAAKQAAVVQLVNTAFAGLTTQSVARVELASALGAACGSASIIRSNSAVVSAIQAALASMGTPETGRILATGFGEAFQNTINAIPHEGDKASKNPPVTTGEQKSAGNPPPAPKPPDAPGYPNQPL